MANHIPAYLVGGEFDIFQRGEPINYAELQNAWDGRSPTAPMRSGQRTTGRYQLIVGPWEHLNGSSVDVDPLELEWFDTWLKHEHTGMAGTRTPLHYYDLGTGQFDETTTYPFTAAKPTRLYLGSGGTLTRRAVGGRDHRHHHGPAHAARRARPFWSPSGAVWPAGRSVVDGRDLDPRSLGRSARAVRRQRPASQVGPWTTSYTSAPFSHAETVAGPITATIYASSTTSETELVAELEDVTPSGASYPLTEGALLGSLRAVDRSDPGPLTA